MIKISTARFSRSAGIFLATVFAFALPAQAEETIEFGEVVVTAPMMSDPFTVITDPKAPRQPIPAADGGSYLKNIPGFAVSRKGGTDGDPALRGLGGSRLNITSDGSTLMGGCSNRMDPPTAYIYPESYDDIIVLKGPQSVRYGANIAGAVRFERDTKRFEDAGVRGIGSMLFGSNGRNDQMLDATAGTENGYLRVIGTRSDADNYEDGNGNDVHSFYTRRSATGIAGWTPSDDTKIEFSYDVSDGEAAYDDRGMDAVELDRDGYGIKLKKRRISSMIEGVEVKAYHNEIDHIMDDYSLRTAAGMNMLTNPERENQGLRAEMELNIGSNTFAVIGADYQTDEHEGRTKSAMAGMTPTLGSQNDVADFETLGFFGEVDHGLGDTDRIVAGIRLDKTEAEAKQQGVMVKMGDDMVYGGVAAGTEDDDSNVSGFMRWEHDLTQEGSTLFLGLGRAERSPDFWERDRVFDLDTEKITQLDVGVSYRTDSLRANVALFYADISDYILIKGASAENIDATTFGGEADLALSLNDNVSLNATIAYVQGDNDTDNTDLAQMAPLEGTIGISYDDKTVSTGVMLRMVDRQDRVDVGNGTIYSKDIGETPGFAVLSVNAGYKQSENLQFTAGIDNLLDKNYSEHLGKGSADLGAVSGRVNEPGMTGWVKAAMKF